MDPTSIWADLFKISPLLAFMGAAVFYFYRENVSLKSENKTLQEDKLALTRSLGDVTNVANRHIESSNEFMKSWPQVLATAIGASQEKIISEIRGIK